MQSRDIERREKDGGELMRKLEENPIHPIDNPGGPLAEGTVPNTGSMFEKAPLKMTGQRRG